MTSSDDVLNGSLYIDMQNDDKECEHRISPGFLQSSGPRSSGPSRLSDTFLGGKKKFLFF